MPGELRSARPDDAAGVAQIDAQVSAHPWSLGQFEAVCNVGDQTSTTILVFEHGARLEGFVVYTQVLDEASILNIAVHCAHQGKGLGGEILRAVLQRMKESGAARCLLEVRESNAVARRLYRAHCFVMDGVRKNYYPTRDGREDALLMSLEL